jgi:glutamate/tyrosine decarboxylase-like PLP-dependent enzyme
MADPALREQWRWAEEGRLLEEALGELAARFPNEPPFAPDWDAESVRSVLSRLALELADNYPYFHPQYLGQMLKPPHPVARLAWALALTLNPNNHARDGGRATSRLEQSCIAQLGRLFGWDPVLGHLTGGGTIANLEALWVGRELQPERPAIVASTDAHYTHGRMANLLGIPFIKVPVGADGAMRLDLLDRILDQEAVGTVVATVGTTGWGAIDPVEGLVERRDRYRFRLHADAAYGGYFYLIRERLGSSARLHLEAVSACDSIAIDPHKHGLQPYGCGAILFRDPAIGSVYRHESPYTYFTSDDLHLGEISLECSRPGAAAASLWATLELLPLVPDGPFADALWRSCCAARTFAGLLGAHPAWVILGAPELDILVFSIRAPRASVLSRLNRAIFDRAAADGLHLALLTAPVEKVRAALPGLDPDVEVVTLLRACLMKPEHLEWCERLFEQLERVRLALAVPA